MNLHLADQFPTALHTLGATVAKLQNGPAARAGTTTTYMAAPMDPLTAWVNQWGTSLQVFGATVLVICVVIVGIKLGARSAVSSGGGGGGGGMRETMGSVFGLLIAGLLIGAALILGPIFISVGKGTGTP